MLTVPAAEVAQSVHPSYVAAACLKLDARPSEIEWERRAVLSCPTMIATARDRAIVFSPVWKLSAKMPRDCTTYELVRVTLPNPTVEDALLPSRHRTVLR